MAFVVELSVYFLWIKKFILGTCLVMILFFPVSVNAVGVMSMRFSGGFQFKSQNICLPKVYLFKLVKFS